MINQAVLLCAGKGTRLGEISANRAKPLVEVAGKPFITWLIDDLLEVGLSDIVLIVGHMRNQFDSLSRKYNEFRLVQSNIIVNRGVLGIPGLKDKFLLANGDCYPIFKNTGDLEDFLVASRRSLVGVKEKSDGDIGDCGLGILDKVSVEMSLVNCGKFSSMLDILGHYYLEGNLHINDPEGLEGAQGWLSGKTSTVISQQHSLTSS